jgi:two-component system, OmpR family, KDP operon response regulator KdpE
LPELVLLDLGLPDIDGLEVLHRLREWSTVPILVISVRGQEAQKIAALDGGADDYVTKPFGMGELLARIRAALRHRLQTETKEPVFRSGGLTVDLVRRLVSVEGHEVKLTPKEYDLLRVLVTHAGKVLTHRQLLQEV